MNANVNNTKMTNSVYFLGFEETKLHSRDWEKDCFYDTYGLNENEDEE